MDEPFDLSAAQIDLLLRYLAGQATPAEIEDVVRWLTQHPERARTLATLEQAFGMAAPAPAPVTEESSAGAAWERLAARLPEKPVAADELRPLVLHRRTPIGDAAARSALAPVRARSWLRAAGVLLAIGAGAGLWRMAAHGASTSTAGPQASGYVEYATRPGERASFTLADGTQVVLGVASRLRVPRNYGQTSREVHLDGEAYFEVHHDAGRQFLVRSAHGITEDLGTRFDVRDYAGDTAAQVVVAEGRVALQSRMAAAPAKPVMLTAGRLGRATAAGVVLLRENVDVGDYLAWLDGRLVLRNTPLRDALPLLSRWYDLDFRLGDSTLAASGITATLTSQPIAGVLDLLAVTLGVRVEREGRVITLYSRTASLVP